MKEVIDLFTVLSALRVARPPQPRITEGRARSKSQSSSGLQRVLRSVRNRFAASGYSQLIACYGENLYVGLSLCEPINSQCFPSWRHGPVLTRRIRGARSPLHVSYRSAGP
jgi:hypothetical protein